MTVVIRRRAGLMALLAVVSAGLSLAYAFVFTDQPTAGHLAVALVLAAIAGVHGLAWRGARTPLLVADDTGIRTRLGADWVGLPWTGIERVEVEPRGRLTDGRVTVVPQHLDHALAPVRRRGRFAAGLNRFLYDAPLAVTFGWNTHGGGSDLLAELERVAEGRTAIVLGGESIADPSPTVELIDEPQTADGPAEGEPPERARPISAVVSALKSATVARRSEVTLPARPEPAVMGNLALSNPVDDATTDPLPELAELRRTQDTAGGNVSLIIDSTTSLSARAMSKVRRPAVGASAADLEDTATTHFVQDLPSGGPLVGTVISAARGRLGLTVDELADRTRIRPHVIECIELDDFSPCGGDFYARGHLRMLARVLGIEPQPLITTYDAEFANEPVNPRDVFEAELATGGHGAMRGAGAGPNWAALLAAVLVLMLLWGIARYVSAATAVGPDQEPTATQNSRGLGSPGPGNTPIPPTKKAGVTLVSTGESRVVVKDGDGDVLYQGRLQDGDVTSFRGEAPLEIVAQDGGAVDLKVRGRDLGAIGAEGERATYTVEAQR